MRILVVEDFADSRDALALMLQIEGFEVRCAADGREGFHLAQTEKPDLIVTDIAMPVVDGIEMIRLIRQQGKNKTVPIIAVTAYAGYMQTKAIEAGANSTLSKPYQFDLLYELIQMLLKNRS